MLIFLVLFPIVIGLLNYFIGKKFNKVRDIVAICCSVIELIVMLIVLFDPNKITNSLLSFEFVADGFRKIYGLITIFMWMATIMFSKQYMKHYENKDRYYLFYLLTLAATVGVFFSDSLWTTFMFFEMMSLTSFVLVIHDEKKETISAAYTYLAIGIISGMILLMGMFLINSELKTLSFDEIYQAVLNNGLSSKTYAGGICLLLGFGAKAGMFPFHIWLPKAHAVAPAPASALLSGVLTKTGVFGIILICGRIFFNSKSFAIILFVLALITMLLGAILAVFSINFKRTLACSSMSQIGFILSGLAMMIFLNSQGRFAVDGSFMHMANHSLIKLVLFMVAGIIYMNMHDLNINTMKGYGRKKYVLMICFALACLSIMCIPGFSGYYSKTLLHEAIVEYGHLLSGSSLALLKIGEYVFLFSGGLTIAYMLKLFVCVFIEKNNDSKLQEKYDKSKSMNPFTCIVLIVSVILMSLVPYLLNHTDSYQPFFNITLEEHVHKINFFSFECLKGALISLIIGCTVYFGIIRVLLVKRNENKQKEYINVWPEWLDIEKNIYRPVLFIWKTPVFVFIFKGIAELLDIIIYLCRKYIFKQYKYQFDGAPVIYKIGQYVDKTKGTYNRYSYRFLQTQLIVKDTLDTINSTFAFDFLVALIGIVTLLSIILFSL